MKTALIVIGAIVAVLVAIGFIRVGAAVKYDEAGFMASIKIAFKTLILYPKPERPEKLAKAKKERPKKEKPAAEKEEQPKEKMNYIEMLGGVRGIMSLAREALSDFFSLVYTDRLVLRFVSAKKDDPATTATNYGYACAAAGIIAPLLENNKNVSYYSIKLDMDYEAEKPTAAGELKISVSVGRVVRFGCKYGFKILRMYLKYKKKGGKHNGKASIQYA